MAAVASDENQLGTYLKDRRAKLDPAAFGIPSMRRRTPGLRREEVAQRANVSATWYTWLEQGRGGTPSVDVLDGIANALALTPAEREHLFLLAQNRPPEVRYKAPEPVTPQLQRVLDSLPYSPALVKTIRWDIVAWNKAAQAMFADYESIPPEKRNVLRIFFSHPSRRQHIADWETSARSIVAAFRSDSLRTGATESVQELVDELLQNSPEFAAIWRDNEVQTHGEGTKHFRHSTAGLLTLEYSAFEVTGRPDLSLIIYTPATPKDAEGMRTIIESQA